MWLPSAREYLCHLTQKQNKKTPTKNKKEEERQWEPSVATQYVQCPQPHSAPGLGWTLRNWEASQIFGEVSLF